MNNPPAPAFLPRHDFEFPDDAPESFEGFRTLLSPMFDLLRVREDEPFFARSSIVSLTDVLLSTSTCGAARFERSRRAITRSAIDDVVVQVYLDGAFTFEIDGHLETVRAGEIAFFDMTRVFSVEAAAVHNIALSLSRRRLAALTPAMHDLHGFVLREGAAGHLLLAHLRACVEIASRIGVDESAAIGDATLRLAAACLQSTARRAAATARHGGLASLAEIRDFIEQHLRSPELGPAVLMDAFQLSRATLYRFFEPMGGVAAYILERRLRRALRVMTSPEATEIRIKQLAHDLGFAHASAFTRAFKKQFGVPPHEVRSLQAYPNPAGVRRGDERAALAQEAR